MKTLEAAIESDFGFPVKVLLRDAESIRALVDALPDDWVNDESAKCDVMFLAEEIDSPDILDRLTIKPEIDEVRYVPGAVLWRVERPNATRSGMLKLVGTELYAQMTVGTATPHGSWVRSCVAMRCRSRILPLRSARSS